MRKPSIKLIHLLLLVIAAIYLGGCAPTEFPFYDDFSDPSTLSKYRIWDEPEKDSYLIVNGRLEIKVSENQDLWGIPLGGEAPAKRGAPLVLIDAPAGDYTAEASVTATNIDSPGGPQALNTQVGLFVFRDEENWLFYGFTNLDFTDIDDEKTEFDGLMATITVNGSSSKYYEWTMEHIDSGFLKIRKVGDLYYLLWRAPTSDIWANFCTVTTTLPELESEEVGMGVKTFDFTDVLTSNVSNWGLGLFDYFQVQVGLH